MKYIFLNLKRFDISAERGGVNSLAPAADWGAHIVGSVHGGLAGRKGLQGTFTFPILFPEAHILPAVKALEKAKRSASEAPAVEIGCQGVHHADTEVGGNFGAFTGLRTANAARELGCAWTMIGHSEERRYKAELMAAAGAASERVKKAIDEFLKKEISRALAAGLRVLFCIGETAEEVPDRERVLGEQLERALGGIDASGIVLAYEPVWAIGPGKTPPTAARIAETAALVKKLAPCPLVYGGGLKRENAESIGKISDLDGGLIALTRFSGTIGFHPDEYLEIVDAYAGAARS